MWVTAILALATSNGYVKLAAVRPANDPAKKRKNGVWELNLKVIDQEFEIKISFK